MKDETKLAGVRGSRADDALGRFVRLYREFSAEWVERLGEVYGERIRFADPFVELEGGEEVLEVLKKHYRKALATGSTFEVEEAVAGGDGGGSASASAGSSASASAYVRWIWRFRMKPSGEELVVPGVTHARFGSDGRVVYHRDYFDSAMVLRGAPVLGWMLEWVKRKAGE